MNKYPVILLLSSWATLTYSAEAILTGEGQVLGMPDYMEVTIQVDSKCYASSDEARKINDATTRKITDYLNSKIKKKDIYNSVVTLGGYTVPYYTYHQNETFCDNTFQKQNNIIFRTQDLENFEAVFNDIQNMVYAALPKNAPAIIKSATSFVTMSAPVPSISEQRQSQLEQQALKTAYQDALSKLTALFSQNRVQNLKIVQASEISPTERPFYQAERAPKTMMMSAGSSNVSESVPVQFNAQSIHKTIYFKFTFDDIPVN